MVNLVTPVGTGEAAGRIQAFTISRESTTARIFRTHPLTAPSQKFMTAGAR